MVTTRNQAQNPSHGTKVPSPSPFCTTKTHILRQVTDSSAPEITEGAGPVASDSLAAESTRANGAFSENRNSEPQGVSGSNSTFANTDTSGATTLDPAADAEARGDDDANVGSYPASVGGQAKDLAVENTSASRSNDASLGGGSAGESNAGVERGSNGGIAPSYVASQYVDGGLPKGNNLTEGGFESDDTKNASFNNEIGGKNDPGRLAEEKFQRENADVAAEAGMQKQTGVTGDNTYDALGGDTSA